MNHPAFELGFWHPFGPHSRESADGILSRKMGEIEATGWTAWSFQYRPMLDLWLRHLTEGEPKTILACCSAGGGRDPIDRGGSAQAVDCQSYRMVGESEWHAMPAAIRVPHTFPHGKGRASAFVVRRIIYPVELFELAVEWLSKDGTWREGFQQGERWCPGIPSRGEFLIRPGGTSQMRRVRAILELRPPYLAIVRSDPA